MNKMDFTVTAATATTARKSAIAPVLMGLGLTGIAAFGVMLASHASDAFGPVGGIGFVLFAMLMAMRYYGSKI